MSGDLEECENKMENTVFPCLASNYLSSSQMSRSIRINGCWLCEWLSYEAVVVQMWWCLDVHPGHVLQWMVMMSDPLLCIQVWRSRSWVYVSDPWCRGGDVDLEPEGRRRDPLITERRQPQHRVSQSLNAQWNTCILLLCLKHVHVCSAKTCCRIHADCRVFLSFRCFHRPDQWHNEGDFYR